MPLAVEDPRCGCELQLRRERALSVALWLAIVCVGAVAVSAIWSYPKWEGGVVQAVTILGAVISGIMTGKYAVMSPTGNGNGKPH